MTPISSKPINDLYQAGILGGASPDEHFGRSMAGLGDINGDGFADFIVGDARDGLFPGDRRCFVYLGANSLPFSPDLVIQQSEVDSSSGEISDDRFGRWVTGGYDVNGDGMDDIVITSPSWFADTGKIYIYLSGQGSNLIPDVALAAFGSSWMTSFWYTDLRGRMIGDINGDGYDELVCLVGGFTIDAGAYIYFGGASIDSIHDIGFQAEASEEFDLGADLSSGSVNGDAYDDIIVGTYGGYGTGCVEGALLFHGGQIVDSIPDVRFIVQDVGNPYGVCIPGDLNGNGHDDVVITGVYDFDGYEYPMCYIYLGGTEMDGTFDILFSGRLRWGKLDATGGDLNRDGYEDLIISEISSHPDVDEGRIAVYFGSAEMDTFPDIEVYRPGKFGETLAWLGDMNGDGWPEFAVGNPSGAGEIYIYTMGEVSGEGPAPDDFIVGEIRIIPNPTRGSVFIEIPNVKGNGISANLYDLNGRCIRTLGSQIQQSELNYLFWDGADAFNRPAPPGTYILVTRNDHHRATGRIVVNR